MTAPDDAREATLALLAARPPEATICPSEVARAVTAPAGMNATGEAWRNAMPTVHQAVDRLVQEGLIHLSWKGRKLAVRKGPYRIRRRAQDQSSGQT